VNELDKDEDKFMNSRAHQHACVFCILQIGENAGNLSKEIRNKYPEIGWNEIKGMRNFIAHGYHGIDLDTIWIAATEDVPALKKMCERILKDIETS
jgi:uncharacterized protein with HEPN domain